MAKTVPAQQPTDSSQSYSHTVERKNNTCTYNGPYCVNEHQVKLLLTNDKAKMASTDPEDKIWRLTSKRSKLQRRSKYEKAVKGEKTKKKLTDEVIDDWITVQFEHKHFPGNTMTIKWTSLPNWDDKAKVAALGLEISQTIRREAGTTQSMKIEYSEEELAWMTEYFEPQDRKGFQGLPYFEIMASEMKKVFPERFVRTGPALRNKCDMHASVLAARGEVKHPKGGEGITGSRSGSRSTSGEFEGSN